VLSETSAAGKKKCASPSRKPWKWSKPRCTGQACFGAEAVLSTLGVLCHLPVMKVA
jgi:hypothetical protein